MNSSHCSTELDRHVCLPNSPGPFTVLPTDLWRSRDQVPQFTREQSQTGKTECVLLHREVLELELEPWTVSPSSLGFYNKQAVADAGRCGLKLCCFPFFSPINYLPKLPAGKQ